MVVDEQLIPKGVRIFNPVVFVIGECDAFFRAVAHTFLQFAAIDAIEQIAQWFFLLYFLFHNFGCKDTG